MRLEKIRRIYSVLFSRHVISSVVEKSRTYVVEAVLERTEHIQFAVLISSGDGVYWL